MKNPRNFFGSCGDFFIFALQTTINMEKGQIEVNLINFLITRCCIVRHKRGLYSNMWQRYEIFSTSTRNHPIFTHF